MITNAKNPASFSSKVAQKDALYSIDKEFRAIRDFIEAVYLNSDRSNKAQEDVYYSLPYSVGMLRASHVAKVTAAFPGLVSYEIHTTTLEGGDVAKRLTQMIAERDAIKAIPVIKPISGKAKKAAAVEAIARDLKGNDTLKIELLKQAPRLANDYFTHYSLAANNFLNGAVRTKANSFSYDNKQSELSMARAIVWNNEVRKYVAAPVATLRAAAEAYGKETALAWYGKLALKLGSATKVRSVNDTQSGNVTVEGTVDGNRVYIDQQVVWKVSISGKHFHQFPARIYVNGKFITEAAFAKKFHAVNA